jgi:hypothetical protein
VIRPLLPKRRMMERALTKGGEMTGRIAAVVRSALPGISVRVRVKAKRKPMRVPPTAVRSPITTLFSNAWRMNQPPKNSR